MPLVPTELLTKRLLLRSWRADDASLLESILVTSWEHLRHWIPTRISAPAPAAMLAERLAQFATEFHANREWRYAMFTRDTNALLGEVSLFPRDARGRVQAAHADRCEVGYWLRADETGRGFATEATKELIEVASHIPTFTQIEIRCDARNTPSAAVPARLGFTCAPASNESGQDAAPSNLQVWVASLTRP